MNDTQKIIELLKQLRKLDFSELAVDGKPLFDMMPWDAIDQVIA